MALIKQYYSIIELQKEQIMLANNGQTDTQLPSEVRQWLEQEAERDGVQSVDELIHRWIMERYNSTHGIHTEQNIVAPTPQSVREQGRQ